MIRILIVAAYASVRAGLHALLADAEDCAVIGEVSGSAELERLLPEARPDVVVFDDNEADGARVLEAVAGSASGLVVLSDSPRGYRTLAEGALPGWAMLRKDADSVQIAGAARAVAAGLAAFDRSLLPFPPAVTPLTQVDLDATDPLSGESLTAREREVLQLMAQGLPNKIIATRLSISQHTVKFHVASILAKLGAASRTEAVTMGARRGLISL